MSKKQLLYYDSYYNNDKDILTLKLSDPDTGELFISKVKKPTVDIYTLKPGVEIPQYYVESQPIENLDITRVNYKWRPFDLAKKLNNYHTFRSAIKAKKMRMNEIYLDRRCIGSDKELTDLTIMKYLDSLGYEEKEIETETYDYIDKFGDQFEFGPQNRNRFKKVKKKSIVRDYNDVPPVRNLHKGFYDIETDIENTDVREDQPITCSTYMDMTHKVAEVFVLERADFKGQSYIKHNEEEFKARTKADIKRMIDASTLTGKARETLLPKFHAFVDDMTINIHWYKSEATMIRESWKIMTRMYKPQFLGIYNAVYDIGQTEMRADKLGVNKSNLFCHPDVGDEYYFNNRNTSPKAAERRHDYQTESYTKIVDTQITYFGLRPQDNLESESLDFVAKHENGFGKRDYSHITDHIRHLPYLDFVTYLMYNIMDVAVMVFLEMKTSDIDSLITRRFIVRCEYARVFSPMNNVTNTFYHNCRRTGFILSNSVNKFILSDDERLRDIDNVILSSYNTLSDRLPIEGGLCSDPNLYKKVSKSIFPGLTNIKFLEKALDADAVSMYPKIIEHTNISKDSVGGRVTKVISEKKKKTTPEQALLSLIMKCPFDIGNKFFGLPNPSDIMYSMDNTLPELPDLSIVKKEKINEVHIDKENVKISETLRKLLSSFDNTKYDPSDMNAGEYNSNKHFHIRNNESIMKINGSKYIIKYIPNEGTPNLNTIFGIDDDRDAFLKYAKGVYSNNVEFYIKPKDFDYSNLNIIYDDKLDENILDAISNDKFNLMTFNCETKNGVKRIDLTNRSHIFLSNNVNLKISDDDLFIFEYEIPCGKFGHLSVTILSQTLQY